MDPDSQYENYMSNKGPISAASEVLREGAAQVWGRGSSGTLRARVLSGSMIMLVSSGLVGAMNLVYNLAIAHGLGAAGFGHASAVYTVLMLLSSVTLSFQLLCSKFVATNDLVSAKVGIYRFLHRRAWLFGGGISLLLILTSPILSNYLNLPTRNYIVLLAAGIVFFVPLGVRRGLMQGMYDFPHLAGNFVLEVIVKLGGALLLIRFGLGVTGVIAAVVASIVVSYLLAKPGRELASDSATRVPATLEEGVQAIVFFVGQVIINNLDLVLMSYEISRKIGNVSWLQLGFSGAIILGIYLFHGTLQDVIIVQLVVMMLLLISVSVPFFRAQTGAVHPEPAAILDAAVMQKLRRVSEDEAISEFLKSEFYQPEFDRYREQFEHIVEHPDLSNSRENTIRRALLYLRRGRLWRELPADTEWWEVELHSRDLHRIRVFPRNHWRGLAEGNFYLADMLDRIREKVGSNSPEKYVAKLRSLSSDVANGVDHSSVLLIGIDESGPFTIIEGNHRMAAASLVAPDAIHRRFRFLCGFSPRMNECCWYQTDLSTLWRYFRNYFTHLFENQDVVIASAAHEIAQAAGTPRPDPA